MSLEAINGHLKGNQELIDEVKSYFDGSNVNADNVKRITNVEGMRDEAISKYGSLKGMLREITGLEELSKDNVTKAFGGSSDALEAIKSDNSTLQQKLADLKSNYDGLESKHLSEIDEMIMLDTLRGLDMSSQVWNDRALKDLTKDLLLTARRESGSFVFQEDGKTLFNSVGQPMSVEDKIAELKESKEAYYFKPISGGGGGGTSAPQNNTPAKSSSDADVANYYRKHGVLPPDFAS